MRATRGCLVQPRCPGSPAAPSRTTRGKEKRKAASPKYSTAARGRSKADNLQMRDALGRYASHHLSSWPAHRPTVSLHAAAGDCAWNGRRYTRWAHENKGRGGHQSMMFRRQSRNQTWCPQHSVVLSSEGSPPECPFTPRDHAKITDINRASIRHFSSPARWSATAHTKKEVHGPCRVQRTHDRRAKLEICLDDRRRQRSGRRKKE